ncbi:Gfo/Idh/MocA family protein [Cohnella sp. GCM10012308]|uniref:Gfo/Idh/MocA family protein n=1 Tax=Cohnella sp. GCM10012308 TaxID=3317329 RepID=UPI0036235DDB
MKTYAVVGTGGRSLMMFAIPFAEELKPYAALVGVCDINPVRAERFSDKARGAPVYADFDRMLEETQPDTVIVTTPDHLHDEYIIRALEAGCDVISEKPMTTDASKCNAILDAERRTGKKVTVTFNCRFMPYVVRVKELLKDGTIGELLSVNLEWSLDKQHGSDYFRRWHRRMVNSGGLLVHKSTHHFDMVNWWLDDEPEVVSAKGRLLFYGPTRKERGERCTACEYANTCEFYFDLSADAFMKEMYRDAEGVDGYYRDQCVFGEDIDIYDTMSLSVQYSRGALLTYSLNAYSPYEGWKATFVGTKGRIEAQDFHSGFEANDPSQRIKLYRANDERTILESQKVTGLHGGGDQLLRRMLFAQDKPDPLGQMAGSRAGAMSMIIGAAANVSIAENRPIAVKDLLVE